MSGGIFSALRAAAEVPARIALVDRGREISFRELAGDVRRTLARLLDEGVDSETSRVALVGETRYEHVVAFWALAELAVPVILLHPGSTTAERERDLAEIAAPLIEPPVVPTRPRGEDPGLLNGTSSGFSATRPVNPERALAIVRTSGTSGRPRWVVLSRRAFAAAAEASALNLGWRDGDRWLLGLPIAHVGGLSILTRCLAARRTAVLEPVPRFDARRVAGIIDRRRVTLLSVVPTMLRRLLDLDSWRPTGLRAILVGGAAAPPALLEEAHDRGWPVLVTYGLTEACSQVATQPYSTRFETVPGCGPPLRGVEIRIRDGVIELRGASLLSAYLGGGPEGEAPSSPFTAGGWFRTGDLGTLDDRGHLHVLGRRDQVVVTGGENVNPEEIEEVLNAHPAIAASCVFGVDDAEWGQQVVAAVAADGPLDEAELADFLAHRLAPFKRPRQLARLPSLPEAALGKVDRAATRRLAMSTLKLLKYSS